MRQGSGSTHTLCHFCFIVHGTFDLSSLPSTMKKKTSKGSIAHPANCSWPPNQSKRAQIIPTALTRLQESSDIQRDGSVSSGRQAISKEAS